MPIATATIPTAELRPGQFFRLGNRWYRAYGAPTALPGSSNLRIKIVEPTTGGYAYTFLHSDDITVSDGNAVPVTFRPATLIRKAKAARAKAAELEKIANQLDVLAIDMQHEARQTA